MIKCQWRGTPKTLRAPRSYRHQNFSDCFAVRFRPEIALAVNTDADGVGVHVAFSDNEHGMHFHLFGPLNFAALLATNVGVDLVHGKTVLARFKFLV